VTLTISLDRQKLTRPSWLGKLAKSALSFVTTVASKALTPAKPVLANLAHIPLTVAGTGCIDYASFHLGGGWGWLVTGLSLLVLEHLVADER
jgi:hypothetical protein